jgi:hypothetical protein
MMRLVARHADQWNAAWYGNRAGRAHRPTSRSLRRRGPGPGHAAAHGRHLRRLPGARRRGERGGAAGGCHLGRRRPRRRRVGRLRHPRRGARDRAPLAADRSGRDRAGPRRSPGPNPDRKGVTYRSRVARRRGRSVFVRRVP